VADSYLAARFAPTGTLIAGDVVTDWHGQCAASGAVLDWYLQNEGGTFLPLRTPQAADEWASLPHRIGDARVVITGRHHGVCAAIVAGRPFVALASNSHKIEATLEAVGLARLVVATPQEAVAQRDWALQNAGVFRALAARLTGGRSLSTFAALGSGGPDREAEEVAVLAADVARHVAAG
jgi:exopolysaccharide biosynthesis predicted pyruvyltransferase EpsI